jgi:CRISPR-associated protein Csx10
MIALTFEIHALEPLLITRLEGDPNSSVSYPYVPGSVVRGVLANRYLPAPGFDLAGDEAGRRLFFDGGARYLNAYPLDRLGKRTLPAPLSWFREKGETLQDGILVYDFSLEAAGGLEQPKGLGECFCRLSEGTVEFAAPQWQINVHTARERIKGRATEEEGAVFRYQALAAGERFGSVILVSTPEDGATLKKLLEDGDLWLGGSRSGGYGRARIEKIQPVDDWTETPTAEANLAAGDRLVLTLLSDTVLRDADGAYADSLKPELLSSPLEMALKLEADFKRVTPLGGFNRKWGLPLYQAHVLQAGSVFVFEATQSIAADVLRQLESDGLGERRVEGFGRVAINWHAHDPVLSVQEVKLEPLSPKPISLSENSQELARQMVGRLLRRDLDQLLADNIHSLDLGARPWPSNAQLSRLRSIALNALPSRDVGRLHDFLSDDRLKSHAREQYREARVDHGVRLLDWLRERLARPQDIWERLDSAGISLPEIGGVKAELTEDLAKEYTIRLMAGVLHRAAKERANE